MADLLERVWQGRRISYPRGARIPTHIRRDSVAQGRGESLVQDRRESNFQRGQERLISNVRRTSLTPGTIDGQERRMSNIIRASIAPGTLMDHYARRRLSATPVMSKEIIIEDPKGSEDSKDAVKDHTEKETTKEEKHKEEKPMEIRRKSKYPHQSIAYSALQINKKGKPYPVKIANEFHKIIFDFTDSKTFSGFILLIILVNTGMLIASTSDIVNIRAGWYFAAMDNMFLGIYVMEIVLKVYAWRGQFFLQGWNNLDFAIVVFNSIDFVMPLLIQNMSAFNGAAIFRILRIFRAVRAIRALRVLRTIRFLSNLQVIMTTILQSIRSIGAIVLLILLFMYMFAVIGRGLYADVDQIRFGNLFAAFFTLFQLLTLDDWFEIYKNISEKDPRKWHVILFLLLYIVVEYFVFLNLFVAVLVDNFQLTLEAQNRAKKKSKDDSDDEDDFIAPSIATESISSSSSEEVKLHRSIQEQYPGQSLKELDKLSTYFLLLSSIEYNEFVLREQQRVLNMMVDLCAETNDDL